MKNILEIIISCQEQQAVAEEELRLCVVALSAMLGLVERQTRDLVESILKGEGESKAKLLATLSKRDDEIRFKSRKMPPGDYLGPDHTPGTPENLHLRKMAKAVFKRATGKDL